jgi:branched-subunit amino acid aminotransferase/4-amino-4-deoxychorismate lyase
LRNSEGIFITQSVLGIVPVAAFNGGPVAPSPWVEQISCAYRELLAQP